eukprot:GFUD01010166.1.p1 GENE.GFUD01010166.1~~GFUD01010166.1.p1  ORF type:complete len:119 (+),score=20.58 GFUD01010166.1:293-649(+)
MDPNKGFFEGVKRRRVQHFLLDLGAVWAPGHQEQLLLLAGLCGSLALVFIFKVIQTISALHVPSFLEIIEKILIFGIAISYGLNSDGFLFLDVKNNISRKYQQNEQLHKQEQREEIQI